MSTISSVDFKTPTSEHVNHKYKSEYFSSFMSVCLWTIAALITATNTDISPNAHGIAVSVTVLDVLTMLVTTWLLVKGLNEVRYFPIFILMFEIKFFIS